MRKELRSVRALSNTNLENNTGYTRIELGTTDGKIVTTIPFVRRYSKHSGWIYEYTTTVYEKARMLGINIGWYLHEYGLRLGMAEYDGSPTTLLVYNEK